MIEDSKHTGVPNGASFSRGRMQLVKPQQAMNSGRASASAAPASSPAPSNSASTAKASPYRDEVGPLEQYLTKLNDQTKLVKAIQNLGVDGFRDVVDQLGGPYKEMLSGGSDSKVFRRQMDEYGPDPIGLGHTNDFGDYVTEPVGEHRFMHPQDRANMQAALISAYQGDDPELQMRASMMGKAMGRNPEAFTQDEQNYMAKLRAQQIVNGIANGIGSGAQSYASGIQNLGQSIASGMQSGMTDLANSINAIKNKLKGDTGAGQTINLFPNSGANR